MAMLPSLSTALILLAGSVSTCSWIFNPMEFFYGIRKLQNFSSQLSCVRIFLWMSPFYIIYFPDVLRQAYNLILFYFLYCISWHYIDYLYAHSLSLPSYRYLKLILNLIYVFWNAINIQIFSNSEFLYRISTYISLAYLGIILLHNT